MISIEDALQRMLDGLAPAPAEMVALSDGWNRVSAEDIRARLDQPPSDVSAMDGYALRAVDGALNAVLRQVGAAPAGHPFAGRVGPGEAVRIFTGAVVPDGADSILLQEDAAVEADRITVREAVTTGRHIRRRGLDFTAGEPVIAAGRRLTARDIGLAAAANHPWLLVRRRPRVAILATGDEIALPGEPLPPGGIVSSNSHALAALVRAGGGEAMILPVAPDTIGAVAATADSLSGVDLLVTTGGASEGDHDLVIKGLSERGMTLDFWKIAMRPGKPLLFGRLGGVRVLGLPGNPVSSLICGIRFLVPVLARLSGLSVDHFAPETALLGVPVRANDHRADHLRAILSTDATGRSVVTPFEQQDSSMLRRMAQADALVLRPPNAPALQAGAEVPMIRLAALGI